MSVGFFNKHFMESLLLQDILVLGIGADFMSCGNDLIALILIVLFTLSLIC